MAVRDAYYSLGITLVVVDGLAVAMRIWARKVKGSIGYDDYTMGVTFIGFLVFVSLMLRAVDFGLGAHEMEPHYDMMRAAKVSWIHRPNNFNHITGKGEY